MPWARLWKAAIGDRRRLVLAGAILLFVAVFALRLIYREPTEPLTLLFVIPIALIAVEWGTRAALLAAVASLALYGLWVVGDGEARTTLGDVAIRWIAFLTLAAVAGRLAEQLRESRAFLDSIVENIPAMVFVKEADRLRFALVNRAGEELLGHSRDEMLGKSDHDFFPREEADFFTAKDRQVLARGELLDIPEEPIDTRDGRRWLHTRKIPIATGRGGADFLLGISEDITERKRAEEAVAAAREEAERANLALKEVVDKRTQELAAARLEIAERLAVAAEYRDDDTGEHTQRVGRTAGLIAERLGLDAATVEMIRDAAPLHDVGKIGVPDQVLLKPGRLTDEEFEVMKTHVEIGGRILSNSGSPLLNDAATIALTHHERWDGTGYLAGLSGKQIPVAGRIVAVADVFDALTHDRPYKKAWPLERALAEIHEQSGRQFDPEVVRAFEALDHAKLLEPVARPRLRAETEATTLSEARQA